MRMKKKQCSIDSFFLPKGEVKKALPSEVVPIKKDEQINVQKNMNDDSFTINLISRGSSPPPTSSSEVFEFKISRENNETKVEEKKDEKAKIEENSSLVSNDDLNEETILTPDWQIESANSTVDKSAESNESKTNIQNEIVLNSEEEKNLHWKLEIIEHRIQFGKDLDHPHPAMAPDILIKEGLEDIHPREKTRLKHYQQIDCVEYIPDFWEPRCWDERYPKLNHVQSEFLLQSMIEAPLKKRETEYSETDSQEDYSSASSPSTSASNSSSDDEDSKCEIKSRNSITKQRTRVGFNKNNYKTEKRIITKPMLLRLPSLLFDTDSDVETDLENF